MLNHSNKFSGKAMLNQGTALFFSLTRNCSYNQYSIEHFFVVVVAIDHTSKIRMMELSQAKRNVKLDTGDSS
jgi:hypothetical protein